MMQLSQHFFSALNRGETSNSCLQLKEKKRKTHQNPTNKQKNPTKQKPWAEVSMPWKLKTEIKERKLSLNIAEWQNCRLSLRSSLGPRSLPPDLSLLANSSLEVCKEKIPICRQFAQVRSQSPSWAIKSIPLQFQLWWQMHFKKLCGRWWLLEAQTSTSTACARVSVVSIPSPFPVEPAACPSARGCSKERGLKSGEVTAWPWNCNKLPCLENPFSLQRDRSVKTSVALISGRFLPCQFISCAQKRTARPAIARVR